MRTMKLLLLAASLVLCSSCPAPSPAAKTGPQTPQSSDGGELRGPDPRSAFESSGLLGGITSSPESPVALIAAAGIPESGASLALGGALSTAAVARRIELSGSEFVHELSLASGARASLPGPVLAMSAVGERIVVACADPLAAAKGRQPASGPAASASPAASGPPVTFGSLLCFKTEGEGERLIEVWKIEGGVVRRLLAVPGGRIAAADELAGLVLIDLATGSQAWSQKLQAAAADIAYAPGLVLAASGFSLEAYDESTGATVWKAALPAKARSISAGNGTALVLAESGSLSAFSLADGKGIGAAPGPFDPGLRPIADGARAIAATVGGGAVELDVKSGLSIRSWFWEGAASFIAADRDRLFAGLDDREGRGILILSRAGEAGRKTAPLESPAFDAPLAVGGARGGLLVLQMDGALVLVGREREEAEASSALDRAINPGAETLAAISTALGRFKPRDSVSLPLYLRFDLFAQGMPVDEGVAFTAFRWEPRQSQKRSFFAKPASNGAIVSIYDQTGRELAASIDELGSVSSAEAYFEKGRIYWIVAGWTYQATPASLRLYLR